MYRLITIATTAHQNMNKAGPTTIAAYANAFASALASRGIDPQVVFDDAGIAVAAASDPFKRLTTDEVSSLFEVSVSATGDPCFGLDVGSRMQPGNMHALGFALLASATLREFYERVCNYYKVVSQVAKFHSYDADGVSVLAAGKIDKSVCIETQDAWVSIMLRFIRLVYQKDINPTWVELVRSMPDSGKQPYLEYFNCPVQFDCDQIRIALDSNLMDNPLPGASQDLAQQNDDIVTDYLGKIDRNDIVKQVQGLIVADLSSGTLSKETVAGKLHLSARNLQLKLGARNTSYQNILTSIRQDLAKRYLNQGKLSITEIAFLLGYSDSSNFTRAFRSWEDISPKDYRLSRKITAP